MPRIFYRPAGAVLADVIPFHHDGIFHLFHLLDWRDPERHGEGTPWYHLTTRDQVAFCELGEAIPRGTIGAQDRWIFTGCVLAHQGLFHIFYTAHNFNRTKLGLSTQTIAHATSPDLLAWTKDPAFDLHPLPGYETEDWRDPFVYWNAEAGEFHMLLAGRRTGVPRRHSGLTVRLGSSDLVSWTERKPLYEPGLYLTHECPDLFRLGDWWYLVFSEYSQTTQTRYRMARHPDGPWLTPVDDSLDSRGWYAAKTASDGNRRFAYGWLATREGDRDDRNWQWGGDLVVHEIAPRPDGSLASFAPHELLARFGAPQPPVLRPLLGSWDGTDVVRRDGLAMAACGPLPAQALVEAELRWEPGTTACGLLLRLSGDGDAYYQVRLEPARRRLIIDRWPRPGDLGFVLERPVRCAGRARLRCIVDGSCLVVYVDDDTALSCRLYDRAKGAWGLFAEAGAVRFSGLGLRPWG